MSEHRHELSAAGGVGGDAHRVSFDPSDPDQPSGAVVEVLAAARGADPLELEPIHTYVDTDALNSLIDSRANGRPATEVAFTVDGYEVRVEATGTVVVEPTGE